MKILGIDEVGRGPWAGPLVMGACVLPEKEAYPWIEELTDSKKISAKKREELNEIILENEKNHAGVLTGIGWVSAKELDDNGLSAALKIAARRAVDDLRKKIQDENWKKIFSEIIIDGTQNFLINTEYEALVSVMPKADFAIKEVSAASIIAKVARDNYMKEIATQYPEYGFEKHVGYGTKNHQNALCKFGLCPEHRRSFKPVRMIEEQKCGEKNLDYKNEKSRNCDLVTKEIGDKAEEIIAQFLKEKGHKIIARNYKTRDYEIDIVSATKDAIYFTEVKYRERKNHGSPFEAIGQKKLRQMHFAAVCFTQMLAKKLQKNLDEMPKQKLAAASVCGVDFKIEKWIEID